MAASAALRKEATGCPDGWRADVGAVAKKDLQVGEVLDGEGGFTVWGRCIPASTSLSRGVLPLGLAHGCKMRSAVRKGELLNWNDVEFQGEELLEAVAFRREMEISCPPLY